MVFLRMRMDVDMYVHAMPSLKVCLPCVGAQGTIDMLRGARALGIDMIVHHSTRINNPGFDLTKFWV